MKVINGHERLGAPGISRNSQSTRTNLVCSSAAWIADTGTYLGILRVVLDDGFNWRSIRSCIRFAPYSRSLATVIKQSLPGPAVYYTGIYVAIA